jgi:hypothetical protein
VSASRQKRKRKRRQQGAAAEPKPTRAPGPEAMERGYARSRAKNEEARARLKPLRPGERPTAVTVGAVVAAVGAVAQLVALAVLYDPDESRKSIASVLGVVILGTVAVGMWRARYWAVLGMQTLLALTLILAGLGLVGATSVLAAIGLFAILVLSGALFWFLIKAMARIQMPERPGAKR